MKNLVSPSLDALRVALNQVTNPANSGVKPAARRSPYRLPTFEVFEQRTVLSAAGLFSLPVEDVLGEYAEVAPPALERQVLEAAFTINSLTLRINGKTDVVIGPGASPLELRAGDTLEVVGVDYFVSQFGDGLDGVIAAEGYLHKLDETHGPGAVDYADGRFGDPPSADPIVAGETWQGGLEGSWTVEEGWDRLSLTLIRYFGDASETAASFSVQLQVETPDFSISKKSLKKLEDQTFRVGETAYMTVEWGNAGKGRYHNYLEMDVHHADDMENAVWVGVSVATLGKKQSVSLVLENDNASDPFTQYWTPQEAGLHRLLIAVDPEDAWLEKKESDNRVELWVNVEEAQVQRGPNGHVDGRRVAHGSLEGPVAVTVPDANAGSAVDSAPGTVAVASSSVSPQFVSPLASNRSLFSSNSHGWHRDFAPASDGQQALGHELGRDFALAVTFVADDAAIARSDARDRWRWAGLDGAERDELAEVDALLAGDGLLDPAL